MSPASAEATRTPPQRRTDREAHNPKTQYPTQPGYAAMNDRRRADFWRLLAITVSLAALLLSWLIIRAARAEEHVYVLDAAGNVLSGPSERLSESKGFFNLSALYCTNVALQRSPEGFDLYELLHLYFSPKAVDKLEEHWRQRREDMQGRQLQQKPLVDTIRDPVRAGSLRIVEVRGRLVSAGAYAGHGFTDEIPFTLVLSFKRNPDLGKAGAYPWICDQFDLNLKEGNE